jgi:hypothetical protein
MKSKWPDPVTSADPVELLQAALPAPTPDYDPAVEITTLDLARRNNWSKAKAGVWLAASGWQGREVMVGKRKAVAYRPVQEKQR